jgi:uncharacterized protein (DUF58 family)
MPSPKLRAYIALAGAAMLVGLATGHAELVAIAVPFVGYVTLGLVLGRRAEIVMTTRVEPDRLLEGDEIEVRVDLTADSDIERLVLTLDPGPAFAVVRAPPHGAIRVTAGEQESLRFWLRTQRWGAHQLGIIRCRATDRFGLTDLQLAAREPLVVQVFPRRETLYRIVDPRELQATTGSRVSRERGEGVEFAEIRPFIPGDRVRRINWRVTARRGTPYVAERHPERNADVILFLDTFADVRGANGGTLELAVRAAASLAASYLARKDRVGVVGFGGVLRGLGPRLGTAQLYRILDVLIGSEVLFSYWQKDVSIVPPRLLPAKALVIAITPLVDDRAIRALLDLRARGFDLTVLEISPLPFTKPGESASDRLAHRLWLHQRDALRGRFEDLGVAVAQWSGDQPLQVPVAAEAAFRCLARPPAAT